MITLPEGQIGFWLAENAQQTPGLWLHIVKDTERAQQLVGICGFCAPELKVIYLPAWNCLPYDRLSPSKENLVERVSAWGILRDRSLEKPLLLLVTPPVLMQKIPTPSGQDQLRKQPYQIGDSIPREALLQTLQMFGFQRQEMVREPGDFAVRGSLLDIFSASSPFPLRLDFFGDVLESIKTFDPISQRSLGSSTTLVLGPLRELLLTPERVSRFRTHYRATFPTLNFAQDSLFQAVKEGRSYPGMEHWLPLFEDTLMPLWEAFPPKACSLESSAQDVFDRFETRIHDSYTTRRAFFERDVQAPLYAPLPPEDLYLSPDTVKIGLGPHLKRLVPLRDPAAPPPSETARKLLSAWTTGGLERLKQWVDDQEKSYQTVSSLEALQKLPQKVCGLAVLPLHHGFQTANLCLQTEEDLFGTPIRQRPATKHKTDRLLQALSVFEVGDYVVHEDHGIGAYQGLEGVQVNGIIHDCLLLMYADQNKLYVPVENMNLVSRYGAKEMQVGLDKLGLPQWQARKARVKKRIHLIAEHMIQLAAQRATQEGPSCHNLASGAFDAFCQRFPYAETDDQLRAIEDTLRDLAGDQPMDRLICGDVGFGKTEVALRAAFVAASAGYQVALIVPTTLLARQHFQNFQKRFEGTPFRIAQLSRLVPRKEIDQTCAEIAQGRVHIVIATHALLRREIAFQQLGLLIVDEEQHFGVAQKEKLKNLKANIHVLTLSATPIPRTLQMALSGVRQMSLITTPPLDRLAVQTFVLPFDPVVLREAILREQQRGGQIFYVCPRLEHLEKMHRKLQDMVPEIRIGMAHGQMTPKQLEDVMEDFEEGRFDLLLSTNIVESGIDIATANTLIVHRSDLFGLAQLYQLRGRVGRGTIQGYAYLTTAVDAVLSPTAQRRLDVIRSLDYLGAGFSVASHDADIRGVGNLVGEEQSGHIREVGIELYQHLLEEAVAHLKKDPGASVSQGWTPQIHFPLSCRIPETYITDTSLRLSLYRTLSALKTKDEVASFEAELVDRFGPFPADVKAMLQLMVFKILCQKASIDKLDIGDKGAVITFRNNICPHPDRLITLLSSGTFPCRLSPDHKVRFLTPTQTPEGLRHLQKFLNALEA